VPPLVPGKIPYVKLTSGDLVVNRSPHSVDGSSVQRHEATPSLLFWSNDRLCSAILSRFLQRSQQGVVKGGSRDAAMFHNNFRHMRASHFLLKPSHEPRSSSLTLILSGAALLLFDESFLPRELLEFRFQRCEAFSNQFPCEDLVVRKRMLMQDVSACLNQQRKVVPHFRHREILHRRNYASTSHNVVSNWSAWSEKLPELFSHSLFGGQQFRRCVIFASHSFGFFIQINIIFFIGRRMVG